MPNIWDEVLGRIEAKVNRHSYYTWFKPTSFVADQGATIHVRVPNALFRDWLTKHYSTVINESLGRTQSRPTPACCSSRKARTRRRSRLAGIDRIAPPDGCRVGPPAWSKPLPCADHGQRRPESRATRSTRSSSVRRTSSRTLPARAVAEAPSRSYNPLFIYGGVGLGKTHLMHAIGRYVLQHNPTFVLTYISSERFMNEMINAVRYDRSLEFRERYRSVDVLLVDDIQFLAGKEGTQNEFFHTFNALYDAQKQIVISSDCPPHEIPLARRAPAIAVRMGTDRRHPVARSRDKSRNSQEKGRSRGRSAARQRRDLHRRQDQVEHPRTRRVADSPGRVRLAHGSARSRLPSPRTCSKNILDHDEKAVTIEIIQKFVADYYQLKLAELKSRNNSKSVAIPRQVAMYLCKQLTHASLPEIGRCFGGKHHSTVIHSIRKIEDLRKRDGSFNSHINNFLESFK